MGDLRLDRQPEPYASGLHHTFSNVATEPYILVAGKTHLAVGFLDLGALAASLRISNIASHSSPTRFVGFETSAYCVAKTAVVVAMLELGVDADDILQVWYSSTWSSAAHRSFRAALASILALAGSRSSASSSGGTEAHASLPGSPPALTGGLSSREPLHPDVLAFLRHWSLADVSLADARAGWLKSAQRHNRSLGWICIFREKNDRLALCLYSVTGQLLPADAGSVTMFSIPSGSGEIALEENFLQSIQPQLLYAARRAGSPDIVQAGIGILRSGILSLANVIRSGKLAIELRYARVEPESSAVLASIRDLSPWTILWSNVPDYYAKRDFHRMARVCSPAEDTMHVAHSMNWPLDVLGTSYIDYLGHLKGAALASWALSTRDTGYQMINFLVKALGWDPCLLTPPASPAAK